MAKSGNGSWIARCKAYMKQHGCQLGEAMKALSNKNKGKGKSFRGGNAGVAANAEAFEGQQGQGAASHVSPNPPPPPPSNTAANNVPPPPAVAAGGSALESLGGLFEVGATPATANTAKVMDGGRKRTQKKRRGGRKVKKSRSRSRSRSRHHRHRSRRGGSSSLSFSEYN